ncbi:amidase [Oricola cellulosilytica]|uniref:Amidase n=1 Tax=Oricola cellulosilytica TaxID=1429082 RepID=A0A4R0PFS8_9HYPH|nr:amidase [Oricola cellulosilytica]TCD14344.1 amidase [Oricola cellulosilytica]
MLSVCQILEDIQAGRKTAAEAISQSRALIDARDGDIGAFLELADADATPGDGPLAGIAVGVKDIFDTYDMATRYGSPVFDGHRPPVDAAIVAMLRAAGASVIGKTVTTEFAFMHPAGTVNPRNRAHTPGGSSSGSAAAVAAGMVPAAIGSQTGGSVIRPAAYCGVTGYKPSFRLFPTVGMKTFSWSMDTVGLFAAKVVDAGRVASLLSGRDLEADPLREAPRIGLYRTSIWDQASPAMQNAIDSVAQSAADAGAHIVEIEEPDALSRGRDIHTIVQNFEAAMALGDEHRRHAAKLSDVLREALDDGYSTRPQSYDNGRRIARQARKAATALFNDIDVLLTPSAPDAAPVGLTSTGSSIFNRLWTLTGNPCVNVAGRVDPAGMPLGIQIVGRFGRDKLALQAARWLEETL